MSLLNRGVMEILPSAEGLAALMSKKSIRLYLGIDPTGAFLHLGHAVALRKLQQFAKLGHQVILLVGDGTVKIGDPTGRDSSRPMLTQAEIAENFKSWKSQAAKILDFNLIEIRHNGDWLDKLSYVDLVQLMAKTTVSQLIERDMFQQRIQDGLPIYGHELIYPLLQGYDSVVMDVDLEIGGNDQTFNMLMGRHLQQQYNHHEKWVLSTPLIEGTDGRKMSKSFNNYIALTEEPRQMYGKLMRLKDELIIKYFELLTDLDEAEIAAMQQFISSGDNPMPFKKKLAWTITADLHGQSAADEAEQFFKNTVQNNAMPDEASFGSLTIQGEQIITNPPLSSSEINRRLEQGAARLMPQAEKIADRKQLLSLSDGSKIRLGKRDWYIIKKI